MINGFKSKNAMDDDFDYSSVPTHDQVIARIQRMAEYLYCYDHDDEVNVRVVRNYFETLFGDIITTEDL